LPTIVLCPPFFETGFEAFLKEAPESGHPSADTVLALYRVAWVFFTPVYMRRETIAGELTEQILERVAAP